MLAQMPSRLFAEWMAYAELEPFGQPVSTAQRGTIAALIANANRDKKKRPEPFKASDFMPSYGPAKPPAQPNWQALLGTVQVLNAALGGKDLRH